MRNSVRGWVGLLTAMMLAPSAHALDIASPTFTIGAGNTANGLQDTGNNRFEYTSGTSVTLAPSGPVADTVGSVITFQTRYASITAQDREGGSATAAQAGNADYTITFTVDNPTGATYQIDITTLRVGALTLVTDDAGNGSAQIGAVTGMVDGIANGTLAMAAFGPLAGSAGGVSAFNQSTSTLSIVDSALSRTFQLNFAWTSSVTSTRDEAAIRMGINGSMNNATTADNYSLDGRSLSGDGHFVNVSATIITAPEPEPFALISLGLVALALRARRAR